MKIVSWNVRGVGRAGKRGVIKEVLRSIGPDIVILQETKKERLDDKVVGSLWKSRHRSWVALPSLGRSGGIVIIWDSRAVKVTECMIGNFSVTIKIEAEGGDWWLTGVYGPNDYRIRKGFWEELFGLHELCDRRWVLGGGL